MQTRKLGNSDLELTTVGLGTWAIGGGDWRFGWGDQDTDSAVAAILRAVDLGINWLDTAAVYGDGKSEQLVCRALQKMPAAQRPIVATKGSRVIQPNGEIHGVLKRESILRECEASLQRLGLDTIDLYQLHWPIPDEDIEEGWEAATQLKRDGKVRHIGVSNFNAAQMRRLLDIHPITSLQPPYSMLARDIEAETLPFCEENQIGVLVYSPMHKGLLTGKFTAESIAQLPENDHRRSRDPRFQPPQVAIHLALVDALRPIAERLGCTLAQLSIAWTLHHSAVTAAIVGARSPSQIEATAAASDVELDDDVMAEIAAILNRHAEQLSE